LVGASHYVDDDRMFHREALSLSKRYTVEVVVAGQFRRQMTKDGIRVTSYRKRSKARHARLLLEIFLHLRSVRYDVIHCFDLDSLIVAVIASRLLSEGPLIVYDAHEHFPSLIAGYFRLPKALSVALEYFLDAIERLFAFFCDAFITVNDALSKRFSAFNKPIVIARNVSSLSWFDKAPIFNVLEDVNNPIVICAGNLDEKKGVNEAIKAKLILDKQGIKTCLVLAGNTRGTSSFHDLTDQDIKLTGWVDYRVLPNFLKKAKLGLVLTQPVSLNYLNAQPNKLFAYMVARLPVVASDLPGLRAIVSREKCGILVDPSDVGQIAEAVAKLLKEEELRTLMGKNARMAAEREYNWETECKKLFGLYDRIQANFSRPR